ncbi:hypothetical protein [Bradyrhizobium sp. Rc3b]|uniref:hypothetical protein n=1 Tax=Bradyrhizobium sp. Rc3b TaxID=1855322 RepID=UPI000B8866F5|nr:hypothetical protein [Bradyrhizobium sp. Rc3b]
MRSIKPRLWADDLIGCGDRKIDFLPRLESGEFFSQQEEDLRDDLRKPSATPKKAGKKGRPVVGPAHWQTIRRGARLRRSARRADHQEDVGSGAAARGAGSAGLFQGEHRRRHPRPRQRSAISTITLGIHFVESGAFFEPL